MPTSVLASDSNYYHLWQLSIYTSPTPEDVIEHTVIDVPLTDGYRSSILAGFTAGTKSWRLNFPTLASLDVLSNTVIDVNGASVSREEYLRSLYAENKITGTPFVFQDLQSSEYYFVDFADEGLTMQRMRIKLYSTGIELRQRRLAGIYIP